MSVLHRPAAFALALLAGACTPGADRRDEPDALVPTSGGAVTVVERSDFDKLMPLVCETDVDCQLSDAMHLPLLAFRWEGGALRFLTAAESPLALARSWELLGPDSTSLRYRMRSDVRWSDGRPVTAHDAAWTLETQGNPAAASPRLENNRHIEGIEVEDDSTLVVRFARRYPEMLFHTAGYVAPRHVYEDADPAALRTHPAVVEPAANQVVSGPFRVGEWVRGERLVLVRNPEFQPQPYLERIVFLTIPEETTRMVELQNGTADVMELPLDKLELIRASTPSLRFERRERRFYDYISYNPATHPAFADREVRRALGMAIDRAGLVAALQLGEFGEPAGGPYPPIFARLYDQGTQAPLPYDTAQAKRILDARGWVAGADGTRSKDGRPLAFELTLNAGNQRRADVAQIVQQQWRRLGVDAQIRVLESSTFFDQLFGRTYQAAIAGWGVALAPDISNLWRGETPFNHTGFENAEVNRLFDQALAQPTEEAAAQHWKQAADLIVAEQPYSWLFYFDQVIGVAERLQGPRIDASAMYQNLHEWWVRDATAASGG